MTAISGVSQTPPHKPLSKKKHGAIFQLLLRHIVRGAVTSTQDPEEYSAFSQGISGEMPNGGDVILAACNDNYYRLFAVDLIQSIELLGIPQRLHLHLLEPSKAILDEATQLRATLKHVQLTFTVDSCVLADRLAYRTVYYTAARFLLAPILLNEGVERLLIIDVDAVMNKSPWQFFSDKAAFRSGGFIFRPEKRKHWYRVLASAVFFNNSGGSVRLAETLARSLARTFRYKPKYHIDQILPYYICSLARRRFWDFSTFDIPEGLMSYSYESGAAFWTVKGKSNIDQFVNERDKLLSAS
ncbi:glycosyltransferase family 77 protein [Rhizobium rhizogenes]|nr:glycosyltransferase family 77 protein [Rhizobium rhizogenes]NTH10803.1 glycosyltransferase family 77 protein [Rhizobium rhizogenes]QRM39725.1 glycosyltransferase family 77 protein [Rhizobium rhizogenes]